MGGKLFTITKCEVCMKEVIEWEPEYCCITPNRDCDCQGRPMNPCVCNDECYDKLLGGK